MYDRAGWKPYSYSDYDSGSESHPLVSSDTSQASRRSFGAAPFMFPDSETSDFESAQTKQVSTAISIPRSLPPEVYNVCRRPFVLHSENYRKNITSWDEQLSAMTYNRFQYYSKLRGYAVEDSALSIPNHIMNFTYFVPYISGAEAAEDGKQGSITTIFAVWNTIMGSSLLTMPWGIMNSGLITGISIIALMGGLCLFTTYTILEVQRVQGHFNIDGEVAELAGQLLGPWAGYISKIFSLLVLLGAVIVYWVLMSNFLFHSVNYVFETLIFSNNETSFLYNNTSIPSVLCQENSQMDMTDNMEVSDSLYSSVWNLTTVPIILFLIIGPLINFKSVTFFTKFNSLGTLSVLYIILFVIFKSASFGINVDLFDVTSIHYMPQFQPTFPALSGMAALSFFIHNIIITIMRNNRHQENNARDLSIAYLLVTLTYLIIGVSFYICFPLVKNCIQDNLLNNFQSNDILAVIARVFLFFQLITVYPLIAFMLRSQFFMAIKNNWDPHLLHILGFNTVIVIICILFAIFLPSIGTIIRYTGALCGLLYIFTLPVLLKIASQCRSGNFSCLSTILYLTIPIIGGINLIAQFFV